MNTVKTWVVAVFTVLPSWLGVLAIPVYTLVSCNIIDYATGLMAAKYRGQKISSYRGFKGIAKKISMWLLVGVGVVIDTLLKYGATVAGFDLHITFVVSCLAALWLTCNEIISILENIADMEVVLPPFLKTIVDKMKTQIEKKAEIDNIDDISISENNSVK